METAERGSLFCRGGERGGVIGRIRQRQAGRAEAVDNEQGQAGCSQRVAMGEATILRSL